MMRLSMRSHFGDSKSSRFARRKHTSIEVRQLEGRLLLSGDITPPITTAQVLPNTLNNTGYYTVSPETVNLLVSDPDSPVGLTTYYKVDNAGFTPGNSFLLGDGRHTIQFYSVDQSGNTEAIHAQLINIDSTVPVVTATPSRTSLWPPNHKFLPVTVTGHVSDASGGVPGSVTYHVTDEYGRVQPSGTARVDANGNYSFRVPLQASRLGQDKDGRLYTITVSATDEAGNTGSTQTLVVVPHDQGNHSGNGHDGNSGNHSKGNGKVKHPKAKAPHTNSGHGNSGNSEHGNSSHGNGNGNGHGNDNGNGNGHGNH